MLTRGRLYLLLLHNILFGRRRQIDKGDVKVLLLQHIVSDPEIGIVLCSRRRLGHQMITGCRLSIDIKYVHEVHKVGDEPHPSKTIRA